MSEKDTIKIDSNIKTIVKENSTTKSICIEQVVFPDDSYSDGKLIRIFIPAKDRNHLADLISIQEEEIQLSELRGSD